MSLNEILRRRRAMMGGDDNPMYLSSTNQPYYKKFTVTLDGTKTLAGWLTSMGLMEHLEELTLTGSIKPTRITASGYMSLASGPIIWSNYAPSLNKLTFIPTLVVGSGQSPFNFPHYAFSDLPVLSELTIGGLYNDGYCWFHDGGYFKNQDIDGNTKIGSPVGLTFIVYRESYHASGGFQNSAVAANTTIIQYDYQTGEVLTA